MCYFLYLASPLTLSEVRSMLPPGVVADPAPAPDQQLLKAAHPKAQTVARLLIGRCSCDFVRLRLPDSREDERHLRDRYRRSGAPRSLVIPALERHRREAAFAAPAGGWPRALSGFVAEHARNAGPTLYHLDFSVSEGPPAASGKVRPVRLAEVQSAPEGWLVEGSPALVSR